jgi:hypothetical protein
MRSPLREILLNRIPRSFSEEGISRKLALSPPDIFPNTSLIMHTRVGFFLTLAVFRLKCLLEYAFGGLKDDDPFQSSDKGREATW